MGRKNTLSQASSRMAIGLVSRPQGIQYLSDLPVNNSAGIRSKITLLGPSPPIKRNMKGLRMKGQRKTIRMDATDVCLCIQRRASQAAVY